MRPVYLPCGATKRHGRSTTSSRPTRSRFSPATSRWPEAVSSGEIDFGVTDTDDAYEEIQAGRPVEIIYPDQGPGEPGTLYIPNTLAIIKGSSHAAEARKLVDYLLSPEVEARLAKGPGAQFRSIRT